MYTRFKIIPSDYKNNFEINKSKAINFNLPYHVWPRDMDLTESIFASIGATAMIPLMLDLSNERPVSELAVGGLAVSGTCVITSLIYRFNFKGKHKRQKKWDK